MPVSGAVERRRRKDALRNDMRDQRNRNRMRREEEMRDRRANYQTNRLNAADAIGSQYGPATRSAYLQGRVSGGAAGRQAAAATAQGMRTANYVGQQNAFMNDAANRYGVIRTADANYLTGEGNRMAGYGAMHEPFERTKQAQAAADAQRYVADNQLAGVYDTNNASRFGAVVGGRTAQYQTDVSAGVARDQIASQERLALHSSPERQPFVTTENGMVLDPNTGAVYTEDILNDMAESQATPIRQQRVIAELEALDGDAAADILDELAASYMESNPGATREEADTYFAAGGGMSEYLARLDESRGGKRRDGEFALGDANPFNRRFWRNPMNAVPLDQARRAYGRLAGGE